MNPIPPFDPPPKLRRPPFSGQPTPARNRRSIIRKALDGVGWLGAAPVQWMGVQNIRRGASFIGDLSGRIRTNSERDSRFKTAELGVFDLQATAFSYGISVNELERRLLARRKQTALAAYLMGGLGLAFLLAWFAKVLITPTIGARLLLAFDFLPLCVLFGLVGFYQALLNFQVRVGRTAGWREYLTTEHGFWPRV